ncbi:MAG: DUF4857 domain-containing protein [Thermodesulfobacteriota bacterium]
MASWSAGGSYDGYRLIRLPIDTYDPDRMDFKLLINPLYRTAVWSDEARIRAVAMDAAFSRWRGDRSVWMNRFEFCPAGSLITNKQKNESHQTAGSPVEPCRYGCLRSLI